MAPKQFLIFAAIALLFGAAPRGETVLWRVTPVVTNDAVSRLDLTLQFPGDADGETTLQLPNDWGGERELYRALWDIRTDGAEIAPGETPDKLILRHAPGAPITLTWKLGGGPDSPPGKVRGNDYRPRFTPDHFFVIGSAALPWPEHLENETPARVQLDRPAGLTLVSDLEHTAPGGVTQLGKLAESVIMGGDLRVIETGGARLALTGKFDTLDDAYWRATFTKIAEGQRKFWKAKNESFLVTIISEAGESGSTSIGGTGLSDAFAVFATENIDAGVAVNILSHEMMHTWIPARVGRLPEENEPIGYWFSEGFTDWASFRTLVRSGLWTSEDFAAAFNAALEAYDLSPVRDATGDEIAAGFWSSSDLDRLPYQKGMLIASWLDAGVREKTKGRRDLDDVLLAMQKAAKRDPDLMAHDNLVRSLKKVARWDAAADLDALAFQGAPPNLPPELLAPCGTLTSSERTLWERGFDFNATSRANWVITGVIEGSRAWEAGLRDGMTLTSWSEDSRDRDPSVPKTAGVLDGETKREITWLPQSRETRTVRRLDLAANLTAKQAKACESVLKGQ